MPHQSGQPQAKNRSGRLLKAASGHGCGGLNPADVVARKREVEPGAPFRLQEAPFTGDFSAAFAVNGHGHSRGLGLRDRGNLQDGPLNASMPDAFIATFREAPFLVAKIHEARDTASRLRLDGHALTLRPCGRGGGLFLPAPEPSLHSRGVGTVPWLGRIQARSSSAATLRRNAPRKLANWPPRVAANDPGIALLPSSRSA